MTYKFKIVEGTIFCLPQATAWLFLLVVHLQYNRPDQTTKICSEAAQNYPGNENQDTN